MSRLGRNERCPCGSGRKVKHCCGVDQGPSEADFARVFVQIQERLAALEIHELALSAAELDDLWEEAVWLPARHLALLVALPGLITPAVERVMEAIERDDADGIEAALPAVLARVDTPLVRADLVRAVLALRDRGAIRSRVAAVAVIELASDSTVLVQSALVQSIGLSMGAVRSPGGLVVASR